MKTITALIDYKGHFGSKHFDSPYRSGMDRKLLEESFHKNGVSIQYQSFTEIINQKPDTNGVYIYTSSEDHNYLYKSFIEDVIYYLEFSGTRVIPAYTYLRANNNKVMMELLRKSTGSRDFMTIRSNCFGTKEELMEIIDEINYPVVVKAAEGASGSGVHKAENRKQLVKAVETVSRSKNLVHDILDFGRSFKHKGYKRESTFRKKFIVQNMICGLENDWKVYFFMDKVYVFYRPVLPGRDFKASGGGYDNYLYAEDAPKPEGLLDFVEKITQHFSVPHMSLDIAYDGSNFHLIEIQFLYFGTAGIPYSDGYYQKKENEWEFVPEQLTIEDVYASSICQFVSNFSDDLS